MSNRTLLHDGTEWVASYSTYDIDGTPMVMLHVDVWYFSPSILRNMLETWAVFRKSYPNPVFCHGDVDDEKFLKLVTRFGFIQCGETPCSDGITRRIFVHFT